MKTNIEKTIIVSAPKRSGGTLLNNLFDSHPGVVSFADEAFFWEHVYNCQENGKEFLFVDLFRLFDPKSLEEAMIDRDILPWLDGIFRSMINNKKIELDLGFERGVFTSALQELQCCVSISEIWDCLVKAYANASSVDYSTCRTAFMFGGDWGKSILATKNTLENCRCIFIMRNPYFAIESLKKSRLNWGRRLLHPINLAEVINYYFFFWKNKTEILDERTILIRFEDLVADPVKTMKKVSEHVGVEYTDNLVTPTLLGKPRRGESAFKPIEGIDQSTIRRKIEILNENEIEIIREHLKPILDYFDYKIG